MKKWFNNCLIICISLFISSCGPGKFLGPSITPIPTLTHTPTSTSTSTQTPTPTASSTPTPTPTPMGGADGLLVFEKFEIDGSGKSISNLYTINLLNLDENKLTNNKDSTIDYISPTFSPDGKRIAYSKTTGLNQCEIFIMDINGENVKKISPTPLYSGNKQVDTLMCDIQPAWSPDGTKIVMSSNRHSISWWNPEEEIYIIDLNTYEIKQLTNDYRESQHPWFSPDGEKITFMSNRLNYWNIYIMDVDGKNVQLITNGSATYATNRFPKWSNDGKYIIFHSDRDGNLELYIYSTIEKTTTRITTDPSENATASFSPDNNWIVYQSDTTGDSNLYILNLYTNDVIRITSGNSDEYYADWSK